MLGICKTCRQRFDASTVTLEQGAYTANAVTGIGVDGEGGGECAGRF
jgi:hypothetical protein